MIRLPTVFRRTWLLFACVLLIDANRSISAAAPIPSHAARIPASLVTTKTKQVYRFHFSALQGADAVRLAGELLPAVAKLPADNPLRRTLADAHDRATFDDEYRSLRASFLAAGVDTIYFLADEFWIESLTLPGRVALPGDVARRDRLARRLQAAGHETWAGLIARLEPVSGKGGGEGDWLVAPIGSPVAAPPSPERLAVVHHAMYESCSIQPASAHLPSLPALRMMLGNATPLTVVNLESSELDAVLAEVLAKFVPASERLADLSQNVTAMTVAASIYPMTHVRQVAHLRTSLEAATLAAEVQKQVNGAVKRIVDLDEDLGPLLGVFAESTIMVSAVGSDVHVVMKPPILFDIGQAQSKALASLDQDWTALPAPAGYHWEVIGSLGTSDRRDVFARVRGVRVRGTTNAVRPDDPAAPLARFSVPLPDSELVLYRNLKGQLKVDVAPQKTPPAAPPALELLDEQGQVAAVLRLDLGPGDPRYDLARTRAVMARRIAERTTSEAKARSAADAVENAFQKAQLEGALQADFNAFEEWRGKLHQAHRAHRYEETARVIFQELDGEAREMQRRYPAATLVQDGADSAGAATAWYVDRQKFPFSGQWLFDHGILTLFQDANGRVAGVFATKVFSPAAKMEIDRTKPTTGSAILVGRARGSELSFAMHDYLGRPRQGKLTLNADRTGGAWNLSATDVEDPVAGMARTGSPPAPKDSGRSNPKNSGTTPRTPQGKKGKTTPGNPFNVTPQPANPFNVLPQKGKAQGNEATGPVSPFGLPIPKRVSPNAESARSGTFDSIQVGPPDPLWSQDVPTSAADGYWVHATDKRMNTLFTASPNGMMVGKQGSVPVPNGNLRAAAVGNLLLILENVGTDLIITPSVVGALISADGAKLTYLPASPRAPSASVPARGGNRLELTRDRASDGQ